MKLTGELPYENKAERRRQAVLDGSKAVLSVQDLDEYSKHRVLRLHARSGL